MTQDKAGLFEWIATAIPVATVSIQSKHKILYINDPMAKIFGYTTSQLAGQNLEMIIPSNETLGHAMRGQSPETGESSRSMSIAGKTRLGARVDAAITIYKDHIRSDMCILTVNEMNRIQPSPTSDEDLSENNDACISQGKMANSMLAIAAHELKTPLTCLAIQAQLIAKIINDEQKLIGMKSQLVAIAGSYKEQIAWINSLVDELLDRSLAADGRLVLRKELHNLGDVIRSALAQFCGLSTSILDMHVDLDEDIIVSLDKSRVQRAIMNIVSNAIKYGQGKRNIIQLRRDDKKAIITVIDEGIGIPKSEVEKIFGQYARASGASRFTGTGLGLYVTKEIVDAHDGTIFVYSEPDRGTKFEVSLPIHPELNSGY
jgi:PAS domain S-box-containing protein